MPLGPRTSDGRSVAGILRELEHNTIVPHAWPHASGKGSNEPAEDPAEMQELRQELRAARHESSALRTSLFRSNERLSRLSSEVWRFDTERTQQLQQLRQASAEVRELVEEITDDFFEKAALMSTRPLLEDT